MGVACRVEFTLIIIVASTSSPDTSTTFGPRDWLILFGAPLLAWWLLDISLFIQRGYLDPWLYTGVGQVFEQLVDCYGWAYYLIRFPVTFLNRLFCQNAAPDVGFALLRYALVLIAGGALYAMALRHFGRIAAVTGYLFLFCNPLFLRVINWDLTPFLSVPAALAGAALWLYGERDSAWRYVAAGALFCVSFNAHIFTVTAIGCFMLAVGFTHLLLRRPILCLVGQLLGATAGFALMWLAGWWYYRGLVGQVDPLLFWKVNMAAMSAGSSYAIDHAKPFASWAAVETYFYVPFLWLAAAIVLPKPANSDASAYPRLIIMVAVAALTSFYLVYRFALGRFVIEEFYYFGHIWAIVPLLVPVVVAQMASITRSPHWLVTWCIVVMVVLDFLSIAQNQGAINWLAALSGSIPMVTSILLVAAAGIAGMRLLSRSTSVGLVCVGLFYAAMQVLSLLPPSSQEVFGRAQQVEQRQLYRAAADYARIWQKYARKGQVPHMWYKNPTSDYDVYSIAFVTLGDTLQDKWLPGGGMPAIGPYELQRLTNVDKRCVMLMSKDRDEIARGRAALESAGMCLVSLEQASVSSGAKTIYIDVVLTSKPPAL